MYLLKEISKVEYLSVSHIIIFGSTEPPGKPHNPSTGKKKDRGPEKGRSLHVGGIDGRLCG